MLTTSIVVYKTKELELQTVVDCALNSSIDTIYIVDNSPSNELQELIDNYQSDRLVYIFGHGNIGYGAEHNIAVGSPAKVIKKYSQQTGKWEKITH